MPADIIGIGSAAPECRIGQDEALELARRYVGSSRKSRALDLIYRQSGIRSRGSVIPGTVAGFAASLFPLPESDKDAGPTTAVRMKIYAEEAPKLALAAALRALQDARIKPAQITHLITVSCTGFFAPGLDSILIARLNLNPEIARLHIGFMGCHGALNGLQAARAIAEGSPDARILLCAVELCSVHFQYGDDNDSLVANTIFADGAAAAVISGDPESAAIASIQAAGSCVVPNSQEAMSWTIGDHGFRMTLSARVPELIEKHAAPWLSRWLASQNLTVPEIASWAVHPGGPRILDAVAHAFSLPESALFTSRAILSEHGNMSSPTVLFILERMRKDFAAIQQPCMMLGFGPGLAIEAVLLKSRVAHD